MQELVDAAVAAAGRSGARIAVIVAEGGGADSGRLAPGPDAAALATMRAERDKAHAAVSDLAARLEAMDKALASVKAGAAKNGDAEAVIKVSAERDALAAELGALRAAAPVGGIPLGAPQPDALPRLRDYKLDVLGLDADIVKKATKANVTTYGALEDLARADDKEKLKDALKLTKDQVAEIQWALLRRVRASDAPSGGSQAPASLASASDVPHGHADLPWMVRLEKLRNQYKKLQERTASVDAAKAALTSRWPSARQLDPEAHEVTVLPSNLGAGDIPAFFEAAMKLQEEEKFRDIYGAHVVALRVSMNLERNLVAAPSVDDALRLAGLVHLMETPPATGQASPPAGTPTPTTAQAAK